MSKTWMMKYHLRFVIYYLNSDIFIQETANKLRTQKNEQRATKPTFLMICLLVTNEYTGLRDLHLWF